MSNPESKIVIPDPWFKVTVSARRIAASLEDEPLRGLREGERRLAGFILPPFQRQHKWSEDQSRLLIESLWEGLPVGAYIVNRTSLDHPDCTDWLLDGQQRWTAITDYVAGKFPVYGAYYPDLSKFDRNRFKNLTIGEGETQLTNPEDCLKVYKRLAYGGTAHTPEDLPADDYYEDPTASYGPR